MVVRTLRVRLPEAPLGSPATAGRRPLLRTSRRNGLRFESAKLIGSFDQGWNPVLPMHRRDSACHVIAIDAFGGDEERSLASTPQDFRGFFHPSEPVLCNADHGRLAAQDGKQVMPKSWPGPAKPNIAVNDDQIGLLRQVSEQFDDAGKLSFIECSRLVIGRHPCGDRDLVERHRIIPVPEHHPCGGCAATRVVDINTELEVIRSAVVHWRK
jgi:hypothetical protein